MRSSRNSVAISAVLILGGLAILQYWIANRRPALPWNQASQEFVVTSSTDRGPGSLREAIFSADAASRRAKIILRTEHIVLKTSLPPLVNPLGVVLEGGETPTVIDASGLDFGPVVDVDAPNTTLSGIRILNAPEQAILVRANGFRLANVGISGADIGLLVAEGTHRLIAENSRFDSNRIGVLLSADGMDIHLRDNRFTAHADAAIWAVGANRPAVSNSPQLVVRDNYSEGDRLAIVLGNVAALIEGNEFIRSKEAGIYLIGEGAHVRANRIRNGSGIGIIAHTTQGTVIEDNEVNHNQALAVLVRSAENNLVQKNRLYSNGYGIAFVLGNRSRPNVAEGNTLLSQQFDGIILIGDSPVLRGNSLMNNQLAGLRILNFHPLKGDVVPANPFLGENTLAGNKLNDPVRGEYRAQKSEAAQ